MQKLIVKLIMMLPKFILRAMAKGVQTEIRGRVMDPRMGVIAAQGAGGPSMASLTPDEARAGANAGMALLDMKPLKSVAITNRTVPGPAGDLPVRVYTPKNANGALPGLVWYHQGGCVIGTIDWADGFASILAEQVGMVIVNVDYRLAPEHPFPAAFDDALAAYRYVKANAAEFGIDANKLCIGGDSAGGNLTAATTLALREAGEAQPALQLLVYPWTTVAEDLPSRTDFGQTYPLNREIMEYFKGQYLGEDGTFDEHDLRCSPMSAADHAGLAPALIYTAGFDPISDEGEAYGEKLKAAGVPVLYRCYESLTHSFTAMSGMIPAAKAANYEIAGEVKAWLNKA
ncbi:MAG: alpha/beta hydrolase [Alphaproteobacteria bacterium]